MNKYKLRVSKLSDLFTSIDIGLGVTVGMLKDCMAKEIELNKVFEKINSHEIKAGEEIVVKGFLSPYAPIIEPETYSELINILHEKRIGNKILGDTEINVKPYAPVVSKIIMEEGRALGFLYFVDSPKKSPFAYRSLNKKDLIISSWNQYIPVSMSLEDLNNLSNKFVTLSCCVNIFNHKKAKDIFKFETEEFRQLTSLFYDDFAISVQSLYLNYVSCESFVEHKYPELKVSYGIEISIQSDFLDEKEINVEVERIFDIVSKNRYNFRIADNKRGVHQSVISGGLTINWIDNQIGVYRELDMLNSGRHRKQLSELFCKVNEIISQFDKEQFRVNLSFISDETHEHLLKNN